jgi:Tfp pilus assembly PilM family ATPase
VLAKFRQFASDIVKRFQAPLLGLDIGSKSIKLVALKPHKDGVKVLAAAFASLPEGIIVGHKIKDTAQVAAAIKSLIAKTGLNSQRVAVALPTSEVIIKTLSLDAAFFETDEETLEHQLMLEMENFVPYALDEIRIDYQILSSESESDQVNVLVVAAKNEAVASYEIVIEQAGLKPTYLDVQQYALARLYHWLDFSAYQNPTPCVALLDFGANYAGITVLENAEVLYADAQRISLEGNLTPEFIMQWAQRSLTLFFTSGIRAELDGLLLLGGNFPEDPELLSRLSQALNLPVSWMEPFECMEGLKIQGNAHAYALSCGLALREVEHD